MSINSTNRINSFTIRFPPTLYPNPNFIQNRNYIYKINVKKVGSLPITNAKLHFLQYDPYYSSPGYTYPSPNFVQIPLSYYQYISFQAYESEKTIELPIQKLVPSFNRENQTVELGLVFHIDKENAIIESNENDNYIVYKAQAKPVNYAGKEQINEFKSKNDTIPRSV